MSYYEKAENKEIHALWVNNDQLLCLNYSTLTSYNLAYISLFANCEMRPHVIARQLFDQMSYKVIRYCGSQQQTRSTQFSILAAIDSTVFEAFECQKFFLWEQCDVGARWSHRGN